MQHVRFARRERIIKRDTPGLLQNNSPERSKELIEAYDSVLSNYKYLFEQPWGKRAGNRIRQQVLIKEGIGIL